MGDHERDKAVEEKERRMEQAAFGCPGEEKCNQRGTHFSLDTSGAPYNFSDMTVAITSWFWSLSVPRGMAVIPDHAGIPESQCHPPNIP